MFSLRRYIDPCLQFWLQDFARPNFRRVIKDATKIVNKFAGQAVTQARGLDGFAIGFEVFDGS